MCCCNCGCCKTQPKVEVTVNAPEFVGKVDELVRMLEQAGRRGALEPLKRRFRQ